MGQQLTEHWEWRRREDGLETLLDLLEAGS